MELNEQPIPLRVDARPLSNLGRSFSAWEPGSGSASSEFLNDVSEGAFVTITGDQKEGRNPASERSQGTRMERGEEGRWAWTDSPAQGSRRERVPKGKVVLAPCEERRARG